MYIKPSTLTETAVLASAVIRSSPNFMSGDSALRVRSRNSSIVPNSGEKHRPNGNASPAAIYELNKNRKASIQVDSGPFRFSNSAGLAKALAVSVVLALCLWLYNRRRTDVLAVLPGTYALCSPNGPSIYTVNAKNEKVQCIVVEGSKVIDTGSLGKCSHVGGYSWMVLNFLSNSRRYTKQMETETSNCGGKGLRDAPRYISLGSKLHPRRGHHCPGAKW